MKKTNISQLEKIDRLAREKGMSYGKYVALMETSKGKNISQKNKGGSTTTLERREKQRKQIKEKERHREYYERNREEILAKKKAQRDQRKKEINEMH